MARRITSVVCGLIVVSLLAGCKVFVPDSAFVNGGKAVERPVVPEHFTPVAPGIPLPPTETTLQWASQGGQTLDRQAGCSAAIVYYGHKEKGQKAERVKPVKAPVLFFDKMIRDGHREAAVLLYDKPPPPSLIYRLRIANGGSATYNGRLELLDKLPDEVTYLAVKEVYERHTVYVPYIGDVERKHKLEGWHADPASGGKGTRVQWSSDNVEIKPGHWLTVDIEFEPPAFNVTPPRE